MQKIHTKTGAASFYIVAFTTLLLSVIVVGFVTIVLSEMARTANNDLSQSAYDSALAGVEDAKVAILNYQSCVEQGATEAIPVPDSSNVTCGEIIYYMNHPDCDMVGHILGRISKAENGEILVEETTKASGGSKNDMQQAYTCVKINSELDDYRSKLTSANPSRVIQIKLDGASVKEVESVRISWYSDTDGNVSTKPLSFSEGTGSSLLFPELDSNVLPVPPIISVQMLQSAETFTMEQFEQTQGDRTNRGTIFLVPTTAKSTDSDHTTYASYIDATNDNVITSSEGFLKSNDKTVKNLPFAVNCPENSNKEFACSVSIAVPKPVGGERNEDTFIFIISLPYQRPDADIVLEVCNKSVCSETAYSEQSDDPENDKIRLRNVQTSIDSTGRANDLYRRVETRVETNDIYFPYPEFAVQVLKSSGTALDKEIITTTENGE